MAVFSLSIIKEKIGGIDIKKEKLNSLVLIALFTAVICVCSFISIPFVSLPITMQSLSIALSLLLLGGKRGAFSIALYILIGIVGLPVFSGFQSGVGAIGGVGGGFIIGFLALSLVFWLAEALLGKSNIAKIIGYCVGHIIMYLCGALWYFFFFTSGEGVFYVLMVAIVPYILPDVIKFLIAFLIFSKLKKKIKM